jgi:hypothetical protein
MRRNEMPNVTDYFIAVTGDDENLFDLVEYLRPAIERMESAWGEFILHVDKLFDDVDKQREHLFVGLDRINVDSSEEDAWFLIRRDDNTPNEEEDRLGTDGLALLRHLGIDGTINDGDYPEWFEKWCDRRQRASSEPDLPVLLMNGESKWAPPGTLVDRLSTRYPELSFVYGGTTEHELYERWEAKNGRHRQTDERHDSRNEVIWYIRNGEVMEPPEVSDDYTDE